MAPSTDSTASHSTATKDLEMAEIETTLSIDSDESQLTGSTMVESDVEPPSSAPTPNRGTDSDSEQPSNAVCCHCGCCRWIREKGQHLNDLTSD